MSKTLNLCEHLLFQGRRYYSLGADKRALDAFGRLAALRELPADIAEETQFHLADLLLKQRKFAKARRHLTAALAHDAANGEYHYLMAIANEEDRKGDRKLALQHFGRCLQLDPENAFYHLDAGRFAAKHRDLQQGLRWLHRAAELAPDDPEIIGEVVRCLQEHGQDEAAQDIARSALFRNSRDSRFHRLWSDCRFQELHLRQQEAQKRRRVRRAEAEGPIRLSFQQLTVETPSGRKLVRQDGPANPPSPHHLRMTRLRDRKHA